MLRTHTCGELGLSDVEKNVKLCGWVYRRRDHGKIVFLDLRDRYGITQIVVLPHNKSAYEKLKEIRNEFVILVEGIVRKRPPKTENPKIKTGLIEVEAKHIEILNKCENLPFEIDNSTDISEELRLKYRFLDLRTPKMQRNLIFRHKLNKVLHRFFDEKGFIEIETPFLTKSTPEGARDFLVPSRLNLGKFYALPQSPQLFKQILMVSGFDRYYQIVRCFRDEDLRKDRQPEFIQLDIEMSFAEEEDIFSLMEELMSRIFKELLNKEIKIPFMRLSYEECMKKYNTDKPDLRKNEDEFSFVWITDFPLFKYDEDEKRWVSEHHPFTAPHPSTIEFLEKGELEKVKARSYDLVLNGAEIASGSVRIHTPQLQKKIFEILNISKEEAEKKFGFLLRALKFGAPPHAGIALGLDRFCAILCKEESIREVIAFPKTQKGICPLTYAPSEVEDFQLKELGIKIEERG